MVHAQMHCRPESKVHPKTKIYLGCYSGLKFSNIHILEQLLVLFISLALADEVIHFVKHLSLTLQDKDKHQNHQSLSYLQYI